MKTIIFILALFCGLQLDVNAQNIHELEKYSYFCFAVNGNQTLSGTCFFYKLNNEVYVVTNYHVFSGADILNERQMMNVDTLRISYISSETKKQKFFKIFNSEGQARFFKHYESPDLIAKKVTSLPGDMDMNYVNDLVEPEYFKETPESVIVFGYPGLLNKVADAEHADVKRCYVSSSYNKGKVNSFDDNLLNDKSIKNLKKVKRQIDEKEFQISVGALPGFSGSPVYGKYYKNGAYQYKFMGVVFASDVVSNTSVAIKGSTFEDYMKTVVND